MTASNDPLRAMLDRRAHVGTAQPAPAMTAQQLRSTASKLADAVDYLTRQAGEIARSDPLAADHARAVAVQINDRHAQLLVWIERVEGGGVPDDELAEIEADTREFLRLAGDVLR